MQSNRENEHDLTRNETEEGLEELSPGFRSMQPISTTSVVTLPKSESKTAERKFSYKKWIFDNTKTIPTHGLIKAVAISFSPFIVACRICDSLKLRSVHAIYQAARAICITSSYLIYSIELYKDDEGNTLVEMIRISGCGFAFHRERDAVIKSAQGLGGVPQSDLPTMLKVPEDCLKNYKAPAREEHETTLQRAVDQLHSKHFDVQIFVLKNLSTITSSEKVNQESAQIMSTLIMEDYCNIQSVIVSILESCLEESKNDRNGSIEQTKNHVLMTNASLSTLSNVLTVLSDLVSLEQVLIEKDNNIDFVEKVIPHLIEVVVDCKCPHNACLALRCLHLLYNNSTFAQDILEEQPNEYLIAAKTYGQQAHSKLFYEAEGLLSDLN